MNPSQFSQIDPVAFAHPHDVKAAEALGAVPLLPSILKQMAKFNAEERLRSFYVHNGIQLGSEQLPSLWRMVNEVAERFGMPYPTAYVIGHGDPNAFAFGLERYSIALTSSLVDKMSDRELEAIIAHELGHILCEHMLYRQVGLILSQSAQAWISSFSRVSPTVLNSSFALLYFAWSRSAEFTADRAALLVLQDPEALTSCLSRLAGVPTRFASEFDPRQFADQLKAYKNESTLWSRLATWDLDFLTTHPDPTRRANAILEWADSKEYREILDGRYPRRFERLAKEAIRIKGVASCALCGWPVGERAVCPRCTLPQDAAQQRNCRLEHLVGDEWSYCITCGEALGVEAMAAEWPVTDAPSS